ncbi:MAG: response regulator, partial [Pseudomonadota bacterium]|nr:response regulator [Pseudomonadota bacterium]
MKPSEVHVHKVQILLIDADRTFLTSFGQGLREAGYQVLEAASGTQAVELCRRHRPDLAILDVRMAGMSGIDLARQLREECDLPCLFLASAVGSETVRQAVAEGALGYLVKPLEIQRLLPSVETALSWARELRRLREAQAHLYRALEMTRQT